MALDFDEGAPVLEIRDLNLSYLTRAGEIPAVIDFSLTVHKGESVGLAGESGCGKSTVAMAVMRYMGGNGRIRSGSIRFRGVELGTLPPGELRAVRGAHVSMVYQEPSAALNPSLTLGAQLREVPVAHEGIPDAEAHERAVRMLADVRLPDPERIMAAYPHQISVGQQQRVVIAMALLSNPSLLLLDEPAAALDVTVAAGIDRLVADLGRKYGVSRIYISHDLGRILEVCDRVCVMYSGEVVEEGAIDSLFARPRHPYTRRLFGCVPRPAADRNTAPLEPIPGRLPLPHERPRGCNFGPRCDFFEDGRCDAKDVAMASVEDAAASGHRVRCVRWREIGHGPRSARGETREPVETGAGVLAAGDVRKHHEARDRPIGAISAGGSVLQVEADEGLGFDAGRGETVAIVGESGCGKSAFAKVLMGLETATDGTIRHEGDEISKIPARKRSPRQIGSLQMVFRNPFDTLNPSYTIGSQIGRAVRKLGVETDKGKVRERVLRLLDLVQLPRDFHARRPRQLSGGQKQRAGIARAFAGNPSTVIADEPVSALDASVAAAVTELLAEIQREHGTTLLLVSHDLGLVRYLSDRIVVMYLGRIVERGPAGAVFAPPYHPYTEALLSAAPIAEPGTTRREIVLEGDPPGALDPPQGCPFSTRCPRKVGTVCDDERPPVRMASDAHAIACHIPLDELRQVEPVIAAPGKEERLHVDR